MNLIKHGVVNLNTNIITDYNDIGVHLYPAIINKREYSIIVQNEDGKEYQVFITDALSGELIGIGYHYDYRGICLDNIMDFIKTTSLAQELKNYDGEEVY